jgi:hypothetical protein
MVPDNDGENSRLDNLQHQCREADQKDAEVKLQRPHRFNAQEAKLAISLSPESINSPAPLRANFRTIQLARLRNAWQVKQTKVFRRIRFSSVSCNPLITRPEKFRRSALGSLRERLVKSSILAARATAVKVCR